MRPIDADVLSEGVCFVINNSKELVTSSVVRKAVLSLIDTQPIIEAEPVKHGRWAPSLSGYPFCSNCDWCPEEDDMTHGRYKYCPSCGALMENGDEYF